MCSPCEQTRNLRSREVVSGFEIFVARDSCKSLCLSRGLGELSPGDRGVEEGAAWDAMRSLLVRLAGSIGMRNGMTPRKTIPYVVSF